jgi:hypothetical protein
MFREPVTKRENYFQNAKQEYLGGEVAYFFTAASNDGIPHGAL